MSGGDLAKFLASFRADLGYHEDPPGSNRNKFSASWGKPPEPWCADGVTRKLADAGALDVPQSSYTPTLYQEYVNAGRAGHTPKIGAIPFFRWPGSSRIEHVGAVEFIKDATHVGTFECNTTTQAAGSQRNGGEVARKIRSTSLIVGYGYPIWADGSHPVLPPAHKPGTYPTLKYPMGGGGHPSSAVHNVQKVLGLLPNGVFTLKVQDAVKNKQRRLGQPVTGVADERFLRAIGYQP